MSMIRQIAWLLAAVIVLALGGSMVVGAWTARESLLSQWQARNGDAATLLALALSQQKGDRDLMGLVLSAQFDAGHYRRIRLVDAQGKTLFEQENPVRVGSVPAWFVQAVPLSAPEGRAKVSDGWNPVGEVSVDSHGAWAYNALWDGLWRFVGWLIAVGVLALGVAHWAVGRWRGELGQMVRQAQALEDGRFTEMPEPVTRELRQLATGMNTMVRRLKLLFDSQATQLESLRRQAQQDAVTSLSNRPHFVANLERALAGAGASSADAPPRGGLILVRLADLEGLNRRSGREAANRLLSSVAAVLETYTQRIDGAFAGRLNGADLALYLPVNGVVRESAEALRATLQAALPRVDAGVSLAVGGVEGLSAGPASTALARADQALAEAESTQAEGLAVVSGGDGPVLGESAWRERIARALDSGAVQLAEYPVVDPQGDTVHLECPLRLQLVPGGAFENAARWLPMAVRGRLLRQADAAALALCLAAIAQDDRPRSVHMAAASLADAGFINDVNGLLEKSPAALKHLCIEVAEGASGESTAWYQAAQRWRARGIRIGLDNAGRSLHALMDARVAGLDYLKIDGRFLRGMAHDRHLSDYATQLVRTARSIGVAVYAEGIDQAEDLQQAWRIGFDGATGPAVGAAAPRRA